MAMPLTARRLNRATLERQLLPQRASLPVVEAVRRLVALQAQEPASPYLALWSRLAPFDPVDLDRAFAEHTVLKATAMRRTLHALHPDDYPRFHEAMQPTLRGSRLGDRRFAALGITAADADAQLPRLLAYATTPRANADMEARVRDRLGTLPSPGAWWALRTYGPFIHAPTGGPWSFGPRPSYLAAPEQRRSGDVDASLRYLVRRYLEGFGPASVPDIARFALIERSRARAALRAMDDVVALVGPDGTELFDVPGAPMPAEDAPAPPRLLPMWDSILLAYADRVRVIPREYQRLVTRVNGDVLPTLLVDGYVAGVWRPHDGGIEVRAFHELPDDAWAGLEEEAAALVALLAPRDRNVYGRYAHWWRSMPGEQVRILGG